MIHKFQNRFLLIQVLQTCTGVLSTFINTTNWAQKHTPALEFTLLPVTLLCCNRRITVQQRVCVCIHTILTPAVRQTLWRPQKSSEMQQCGGKVNQTLICKISQCRYFLLQKKTCSCLCRVEQGHCFSCGKPVDKNRRYSWGSASFLTLQQQNEAQSGDLTQTTYFCCTRLQRWRLTDWFCTWTFFLPSTPSVNSSTEPFSGTTQAWSPAEVNTEQSRL